MRPDLNTTEKAVLKALFACSAGNGHDFGFTDEVDHLALDLSPHQVAGYVSSLSKKGYIRCLTAEKVNGRLIETEFVLLSADGQRAGGQELTEEDINEIKEACADPRISASDLRQKFPVLFVAVEDMLNTPALRTSQDSFPLPADGLQGLDALERLAFYLKRDFPWTVWEQEHLNKDYHGCWTDALHFLQSPEAGEVDHFLSVNPRYRELFDWLAAVFTGLD